MSDVYNKKNIPLAERMRPSKLSEIVGQSKLTKPGSLIHQLLKAEQIPSLIFWGPPGCGKTTLARIIAEKSNSHYHELSAVSSGVSDVRQVFKEAEQNTRLGEKTILFLDEIHRFNKAQQDALLPYVERGTIILIGATTENPSFEVIPALLSRSTVVRLELIGKDDIVKLLKRTLKKEYPDAKISKTALETLAELSVGDARTALGSLETAVTISKSKPIDEKIILSAMQQATARHDKKGESHYDLASALIKSMRGSQTKPALYYLHRLIEGGEDPLFIARRIVIFASEDIGMASPHALTLAVSAYQAVERIGMPESNYILSQAVYAMCKAQKSRGVADAMYEAKQLARDHPNSPTPLHLRNAVTGLMKDFGYGEGYEWKADYKHPKGYWPDNMKNLG